MELESVFFLRHFRRNSSKTSARTGSRGGSIGCITGRAAPKLMEDAVDGRSVAAKIQSKM
jgi:hypothetical protein